MPNLPAVHTYLAKCAKYAVAYMSQQIRRILQNTHQMDREYATAPHGQPYAASCFYLQCIRPRFASPPRLRISHVAPLNKCIEIYIPIEALVPGSIRAGSPLQGDLNVGTYIRVHPVQ